MRLRDENLTWQRIDDEIVVMDLQGSSYLRLNDSGAVLWETLAEGADRPTLVRELVDRYELDESKARADVDDFLSQLRDADLLDTVQSGD